MENYRRQKKRTPVHRTGDGYICKIVQSRPERNTAVTCCRQPATRLPRRVARNQRFGNGRIGWRESVCACMKCSRRDASPICRETRRRQAAHRAGRRLLRRGARTIA